MKIVLKAFGQLKSEVLDWPESTGSYVKLVLNQPMTAISGYDGIQITEIPSIATIAEFEYSGKNYSLYNGQFAKIYVLRDIYKIP